MASKHIPTAASSRYAGALVEAAQNAGALVAVEKDMADLAAMIAVSADLRTLLKSPVLKREQQMAAVDALSAKAGFQTLTKNFLLLLAQNRRLSALENMIESVKAEAATLRGEVSAHVQTAYALTPEQTKTLSDTLAKSTGQKILLNVEINKELIGGMIVTVGSQMIDDSVKRKLERLERAMKSNSNLNETAKKEVA